MKSFNEAMKRIPSQAEKIIILLKEAGEDGVTNIELSKISLKYDARISELRQKGYEIETAHDKDGIYKYKLKRIPSQDARFYSALDQLTLKILNEYNGKITAFQLRDLLDKMYFEVKRKSGYYKQNRKIH